MDVILGIDIGGSTTKIVGLRTDGSVISMLRVRAEDQVTSLYGALGNYLTSSGSDCLRWFLQHCFFRCRIFRCFQRRCFL